MWVVKHKAQNKQEHKMKWTKRRKKRRGRGRRGIMPLGVLSLPR